MVFQNGFFDMDAINCWLFRFSRSGGSLAIFISTMLFQ